MHVCQVQKLAELNDVAVAVVTIWPVESYRRGASAGVWIVPVNATLDVFAADDIKDAVTFSRDGARAVVLIPYHCRLPCV